MRISKNRFLSISVYTIGPLPLSVCAGQRLTLQCWARRATVQLCKDETVQRWFSGKPSSLSATFQTAYRFLAAVNTAVAILEQVEGFTLPFSTTDETTPKERQVGVGLYPAGFKF